MNEEYEINRLKEGQQSIERHVKIIAEEVDATKIRLARIESAIILVCLEGGLDEIEKILRGDHDDTK